MLLSIASALDDEHSIHIEPNECPGVLRVTTSPPDYYAHLFQGGMVGSNDESKDKLIKENIKGGGWSIPLNTKDGFVESRWFHLSVWDHPPARKSEPEYVLCFYRRKGNLFLCHEVEWPGTGPLISLTVPDFLKYPTE